MITLHPDARTALETYLAEGRPALAGPGADAGFLFPAQRGAGAPLGMNALSLMLTKRYHAGGGTLPYFGSHRIRHATATFLVNNGIPLEEVKRLVCLMHTSSTPPLLRTARCREHGRGGWSRADTFQLIVRIRIDAADAPRLVESA
jgi:site-specific recombinase XerD